MSESAPRPARMTAGQARFVAIAAAATAFALGFVWPAFQKTRVLWYYPLEHRWALEITPEGLAMDWYGRTLVAGVLAIVAYFVALALARRSKPLGQRGHTLWTAWMATAVLLAMALYAHQLATRRPVPTPLPTWYVPR